MKIASIHMSLLLLFQVLSQNWSGTKSNRLVQSNGQWNRGCLVRQERQSMVATLKGRNPAPPIPTFVSKSSRSTERWQRTQQNWENFWVFQKQWFFCALLELHFWGKPTVVRVQGQKEEKEKHVLIPGEMNRICIQLSFTNHWFVVNYESIPIDYNLVKDQFCIVWPAVIIKEACCHQSTTLQNNSYRDEQKFQDWVSPGVILVKFRVIFLGTCGFSQAVFKTTLHSATLDHAAMLKNSLSLIEICQM